MSNQCTIVMYHYVRELCETRYPGIKGLTVSLFREQLAYMQRFYKFITVSDLLSACHDGKELPRNAALLSFDDGYSDHYLNAFPILDATGIQGVFFPPVCAVRDGRVLDVNKIHFVLESVKAPEQLLEEIFSELDRLRAEGHEIAPNHELYEKLAVQSEFDLPEIIFTKRLLQRELRQELRAEIVDKLFRLHVTENERAFARELYISEEQLRMMVRYGMVIGSHGYEHRWMNTLSPVEQRKEVEESLGFLDDIGVSKEHWLMCYPYGAHDESLREICNELGCGAAFTTEVEIAHLDSKNSLNIPRLDTNHLPKNRTAEPNSWTQLVI